MGPALTLFPASDRRHCLPEATLSLGLIHGLLSSRSVLRFRSIKTIRRGPLPRAAMVGKNQMAPGQQDRTEAYEYQRFCTDLPQ